jgi:hypothetical protein
MLDGLMTRLNDAIAADTLDAEVDRFLCWKTMSLDRQAWQQLGQILDDSLDRVQLLEGASTGRIENEGTEEIPATVALLAFRSPEFLRT